MSIYDDIPLPVGTEYGWNRILQWDSTAQKYLVRNRIDQDKWLPRTAVEQQHADFLCEGLNLTTHYPASPHSTRFFRRKEKNLDDQ